MKTFATSVLALAFATSAAMADGPICEREITLYQDGQLVDTSQLTFYPHGCDRFQYQPMTEAQVLSLGEHCSVESYASGGTEEEEVTEDVPAVTDEVPYGVADGSVHNRDNLTSMGINSNGDHVMRVRSATDGNPVTIRRAGGGTVFTGTVGAGDTLINVGQGGTYIAQTGSRSITKATGNQPFNDVIVVSPADTVTRTVTVELDEAEFYQTGPRTDRCGFPGEAIAPLN